MFMGRGRDEVRVMRLGLGMGTDVAGMGWRWERVLRGWGGDGDKYCGDNWGFGKLLF